MSRNLFHGTPRAPGRSHAPNLPQGRQRWKTYFEQNAFMIMSTGHVDKATAEWLNRKGLEVAQASQFGADAPPITSNFGDEYVACTAYGWFMWVQTEEDYLTEYSQCLQDVMRFATQNSYDYLMLDCDGPVVEGLPVYRW